MNEARTGRYVMEGLQVRWVGVPAMRYDEPKAMLRSGIVATVVTLPEGQVFQHETGRLTITTADCNNAPAGCVVDTNNGHVVRWYDNRLLAIRDTDLPLGSKKDELPVFVDLNAGRQGTIYLHFDGGMIVQMSLHSLGIIAPSRWGQVLLDCTQPRNLSRRLRRLGRLPRMTPLPNTRLWVGNDPQAKSSAWPPPERLTEEERLRRLLKPRREP